METFGKRVTEEVTLKGSKVVIVGGSAAGIEAAITAQKHYDLEKLVVIRREKRALVPCGIPYIMGTLGSVDKNELPVALLGEAELVVGEVKSIDRPAQRVQTLTGEIYDYDKLILATGSRPLVPRIEGANLENVFTVRKEMRYLERLQSALKEAKDVVIVGGGFIGAEFADECRKMGLNVTIVELLKHCLYLNCDEDFCIKIENTPRKGGVHVNTESRVTSVNGKGKVEYVTCENGDKIKADVVIFALGVVPNTELATEAGLALGESKGIMVDQYMVTSDPNIFAIGDCAEKFCHFSGKTMPIRLASVAAREGRIAGANLFKSRRRRNRGTIGVFSTLIGGAAVAVAGMTERIAREMGFDLVTGEAVAVDRHPGSMPHAQELRVKLIFDRNTCQLLGGEACGGVTAGEMVNVIAQAISAGMTADEIAISQVGTHPALTASPVVYQIVNAAEEAVLKLEERKRGAQ
jgi:NADPH-dependent 2,4-dienoyl-CoA reductase/sulfur reductase-like enzyme